MVSGVHPPLCRHFGVAVAPTMRLPDHPSLFRPRSPAKRVQQFAQAFEHAAANSSEPRVFEAFLKRFLIPAPMLR